MSPTERAEIPSRVPDFSLERIDSESLLYHPGLTKAIQLNETASLVWELCDGQRSVQEIAAMFGDAFPESSDVERDVVSILDRLAAEGAVRLTHAP